MNPWGSGGPHSLDSAVGAVGMTFLGPVPTPLPLYLGGSAGPDDVFSQTLPDPALSPFALQ